LRVTDRVHGTVARAAAADVMARSGAMLCVADLAREHGFTDIDGRHVPAFEMAP
jgi:hypothetical protein